MMHPPDNSRQEEFLPLLAEIENGLRLFIRSLLRDREEAGEVMQRVTVILWEKYDSAVDFRKWAYGVARLEVLKYRQSCQRDRHVFDDAMVNSLAEHSVDVAKESSRRSAELKHCLEKLKENQRNLVLEAYSTCGRIDELAQRRGQTPMSLYKSLHRIRQALLECVQNALAKDD